MGNTRPRQISDNTLVYPQRGPAPDVPEGYERSEGNPYVMVRKVPECEYRVVEEIKRKCCGPITRKYCNRDKVITTRLRCQSCASK